MYWSALLVALVPPEAVTVTSTVPDPAGAVTEIEVVELTTTPVAAAVPNLTAVTPEKLVPVMVTEVPPEIGPELGLSPVTVGTVDTV